MLLHWIRSVCVLGLIALLWGCSTDKDELMPHGPQNMLDMWNQSAGATGSSSANHRNARTIGHATSVPNIVWLFHVHDD
jgi:hypothetical protein